MGTKIYMEGTDNHFKTSQYALDLLDSVPDAMYWIDHNCQLVGCNNHFLELIGMTVHKKLSGTPYDLMLKETPWSQERVEEFRLNDMQAIFSGQAQLKCDEPPVFDKKNNPTYLRVHRVPVFNHSNIVIGLAVTLTDITEYIELTQQVKNQEVKKSTSKKTNKTKKKEPKVLIVEDNAVAQQVEYALLTKLNCKVDIASTGDEALELFKPGKYDIVLMDIGLEDTSGYMVARDIRAKEDKTKHQVPILALTSFKAEVVKHDCKEYFMQGALSKPITNIQAEQLINHYVYHEDIDVDGLETVSDDI